VNDEVDPDVYKTSGLAGDEDVGIIEDIANKVRAMMQDLARMTNKSTTMRILYRARAVTTSKVCCSCCNKMDAWNLAMREEMELVSADLRRTNVEYGYMG
jgi:hypothetical protein